ncbi:MAG: LLM class flavin-dependent oxidoreductase [Candidatus Limnocylindrales bacterium]
MGGSCRDAGGSRRDHPRTLARRGHQLPRRLLHGPERAPLHPAGGASPIHVAAGGPRMAEVAARIGDGLIGTGPERELLDAFDAGGGAGPRYGQITLCWAKSEAEARRTALEWWPNAAIRGEASQELPSPAHFEQLAEMVTEDSIAESVLCGPDAEPLLERIRTYADAGYDHIYLHQVGPDQAGFFDFVQREVLPEFEAATAGDEAPGSRLRSK